MRKELPRVARDSLWCEGTLEILPNSLFHTKEAQRRLHRGWVVRASNSQLIVPSILPHDSIVS